MPFSGDTGCSIHEAVYLVKIIIKRFNSTLQ